MTTAQLNLIPELFAQALEQPPAARDAFLSAACADDHEVRQAVMTLLASADETDHFLEATALHEAAQFLAAAPSPAMAERLGRYRLLAPLGRGGMGDVYRARDDLDRDVAIKILPDEFARSPERIARFEREARTLAQLSHPNIAVIYGREQSGEVRFLALEYVPGMTLAARLLNGPLSPGETLSVFSQIASALAATHEAGIIHRDLKPANIMLTPKGQVKLLDFGIARYFRHDQQPTTPAQTEAEAHNPNVSLTSPGATPGTAAYLSPEQCAGNTIQDSDHDARALDLWAFGVVLYESLTGQHPFKAATSEATRNAIRDCRPDFERLPANTPEPLRRLVRQCLEKDPQRRLRDATVAERLLDEAAKPPAPQPWWYGLTPQLRLAATAAALLLLATSGWLIWQTLNQRGNSAMQELAVIAWSDEQETQGCQPERSRAMARLLADRLREIRGVQVRQTSETSALRLLMTDLSRTQAARTMDADNVLMIASECTGTRPGIRYALVNRQGEKLVSGAESDFRQLLLRVLSALRVNAAAPEWQPAADDQLYYQALVALDQYASESSISDAIRILEDLRTRDATNAMRLNAALGLAYYRLYALTGELKWRTQAATFCDQTAGSQAVESLLRCGLVLAGTGHAEQAINNYQQVLAQRPDDPEALLGLAQTYETLHETAQAEQTYRRAIASRPDYWAGYNELGGFWFEQNRYDQAVECWSKVVELLPLNPYGYANLGSAHLYQAHFAEAESYLQQSIRLKPVSEAYQSLALAQMYKGNCADAAETLETAVRADQENPELWGLLGDARHCESPQRADADAAWDTAIRLIREQMRGDAENPLWPALLAEWLAKRGQFVQALASLEKALPAAKDEPLIAAVGVRVFYLSGKKDRALALLPVAARNRNTVFDLEYDPALKGLRADPAYQAIPGGTK
ncbi:MAG: protein kinase [Blastocatellia bacterium]